MSFSVLTVLPGTQSVAVAKPCCIICAGRLSGGLACDTCLGRVTTLLNKLRTASRASLKIESICLRCGSTVGCKREECAEFSLSVSRFRQEWMGWVTGRETWAVLYKGVEVFPVQ
jgi:hypothetical protein